LSVNANRLGITIVARAARIADGTDHVGSSGVAPGPGVHSRFRRRRETERALAPVGTRRV